MNTLNIKLEKTLVEKAKTKTQTSHLTVAQQIAHWVNIGMVAEENPELSYEFIKSALLGNVERKSKRTDLYILD